MTHIMVRPRLKKGVNIILFMARLKILTNNERLENNGNNSRKIFSIYLILYYIIKAVLLCHYLYEVAILIDVQSFDILVGATVSFRILALVAGTPNPAIINSSFIKMDADPRKVFLLMLF